MFDVTLFINFEIFDIFSSFSNKYLHLQLDCCAVWQKEKNTIFDALTYFYFMNTVHELLFEIQKRMCEWVEGWDSVHDSGNPFYLSSLARK